MIDASSLLHVFGQFAIIVPVFLCAVTIHEFSHAAVAVALGDQTPRLYDRYSLNPFKHIDLLGIIFLLFFRVGWAKPVPFNPDNFRNPRFYGFLTGLAGPFSNFVFALLVLYWTCYVPTIHFFGPTVVAFLHELGKTLVYVNIMLGVFNLLPIPPLDGSHLVYAFLPRSLHKAYFFVAHWAILFFIVLFYSAHVRIYFIHAIERVKIFLEFLVI